MSQRRPAPTQSRGSGWRATIDAFGGFVGIGGAIIVLVIVGGLIFASLPPGAGPSDAVFVPRERSVAAGRVAGNPDAPVRIIEFGDYQCPFCRDFWSETEPQLQREFIDTGVASLEFHDFIVVGPESRIAAQGAACAATQNFFWPVHDVLYLRQGARENSGVFTSEHVKQFAREAAAALPKAEFDAAAFERCLDSGAQRAVVEAMANDARSVGVNSTPTFMINGKLVSGAVTIDRLRQLITAAKGGG